MYPFYSSVRYSSLKSPCTLRIRMIVKNVLVRRIVLQFSSSRELSARETIERARSYYLCGIRPYSICDCLIHYTVWLVQWWFGRRWKEAADHNVSRELMLSLEVFFCSAWKSFDVVELKWLLTKTDAYSSYWIWAWLIKKNYLSVSEKIFVPGFIVKIVLRKSLHM